MNFYSLAKRTFFSRNLICLHHACVQLFRAKIFAFREEKTLVESGLTITRKQGSIVQAEYFPEGCIGMTFFGNLAFSFAEVVRC